MAASRVKSRNQAGNLLRSRSEGTLIDLDENVTTSNNNNLPGGITSFEGNFSDKSKQVTNPFWSMSNPFLNDLVQTTTYDSGVSTLREDPTSFFDNNEDSASTSSDETNFAHLLAPRQSNLNRSGKWRSASDLLGSLEEKEKSRQMKLISTEPFLNPDFEWLKNDREAYKMAWLSHRQLTRSCLDLSLMKHKPGWAQTQATDIQIMCKMDHTGGSVQLPDSDIIAHLPQGHINPGEIQEIALRVLLDSPGGINTNYTATLSPLIEIKLSNPNVSGSISLETRMSAEVKNDPTSQVMTTFLGFVAQRKEGPYHKVKDCYIYKDVLQMKLTDLKPSMFVIAAAEASVLAPPASSVWNYLHHNVTVAVYGPKHLHPSLKAMLVVSCHNVLPCRLPFSDPQKRSRNLPAVVLELWGKQNFITRGLINLHISSKVQDSNFDVKITDQHKEVTQKQLETGRVLHLPLELVKTSGVEMNPFKLSIKVKDPNGLILGDLSVTSPEAAPMRSEKRGQRCSERQRDASMSIPEESIAEIPSQKFQDKTVDLQWYGVAMKSVLRQPRVEYLLEYFKGDTIALLSRETVRSIGQLKVKEWYIGFLRGRVGLVHCKNLKVITKDQVIDFTGIKLTTQVLLDNMTIPFKKLTYMYSAVQSLVTEQVKCWRTFAEVLGYSEVSATSISRRQANTSSEKVACVLEKLKEDCHAEKMKKKFQHELITGLLKMDVQGLVAHLIQDLVILSTAVELGAKWKELAERLGKLSNAQIAAYEVPHRGKSGDVSAQSTWKPAYEFLFAWSTRYGDSYREMIQDLHLALDKMKSPVTKQWRDITGALITVNCMEILRATAFVRG